MTTKRVCAACGTDQNISGSLGGVLLCRDHYQDILTEVETLRGQGKQVNVAGIARRIYREQFSTGNYTLRDIPSGLWDRVKMRALTDGVTAREVIFEALEVYLAQDDTNR
jgi:hypothetical protein